MKNVWTKQKEHSINRVLFVNKKKSPLDEGQLWFSVNVLILTSKKASYSVQNEKIKVCKGFGNGEKNWNKNSKAFIRI